MAPLFLWGGSRRAGFYKCSWQALPESAWGMKSLSTIWVLLMLYLLSLWSSDIGDSPSAMICPMFSPTCVLSAILSGERLWPLVVGVGEECYPRLGWVSHKCDKYAFHSGSMLSLDFSPLPSPDSPFHHHHYSRPISLAFLSFLLHLPLSSKLLSLRVVPQSFPIMLWMIEGLTHDFLSADFWQG